MEICVTCIQPRKPYLIRLAMITLICIVVLLVALSFPVGNNWHRCLMQQNILFVRDRYRGKWMKTKKMITGGFTSGQHPVTAY
jgi:hypothetical protein